MSLKVGIVGLPNVGKSTLFNALLKKQQAMAANYPFATIEPNVGIVPVEDERLVRLQGVIRDSIASPENGSEKPPIVEATIELVDIAGIVAGAHKGEGLGNQFLANIREVDLIAHVVRDFADEDVVRTGEGLEADYQTIISELIFKDLETIQNQKANIRKQNNKEKSKIFEKLELGFNDGKRAIEILREDELLELNDLFLLTAKKQILVVNVGEDQISEAESIKVSVASKLDLPANEVVVVSAKIESELAVLDTSDQEAYMAELGIKEGGLSRLAKVAYEKLGLISFLTAGEKEVRAWTVKAGSSAPQAAGVIHTDFEKKFIKAEVASFSDFVELGGWKSAREAGKARQEGKDYVMVDGDVVDFKIGA